MAGKEIWRDLYDLFIGDILRVARLLSVSLRVKLFFLFLLMVATASLEVSSILSLSLLGQGMSAPATLAASPMFSRAVTYMPFLGSILQDQNLFILLLSLFVLGTFALKNIISSALAWRTALLGEQISYFLGDRMFHRYLNSPYEWHQSKDGPRSFQALGGRQSLGQFVIQSLSVHAYALTSLALLVVLLASTPSIILGVIVAIVSFGAGTYTALKRKVDNAGKVALQSSQNQGRHLLAAMNGIRDVLIYRQQPVFHKMYMDACAAGVRARSFQAIAPPMPAWILEVVGIGVIPAAVWIMHLQGITDLPTMVGVITIIMLCAWRILPMVNRSLSSLLAVRGMRPTCVQSLEVFEEMQRLPRVELPDPDPDYRFQDTIELDKISYSYPGTPRESLANVSLRIAKGSQVGFIGISGAGKSTLAGILSGLYEPSTGQFLVDGLPLTPERKAAYMLRVGYVPQTPYIFAGSIADNVAFSCWGREYDREQVLRACRMASLDLVEHGKGIDTPLGANGAGLSGGQSQRVSIARALFCNPELLILDESTSSLDQMNEDAIIRSLDAFRGSITTVIIAHRLSTLEHCDRIFWLDQGRLVDEGKPEELLPRYKEKMRQHSPSAGASPQN